MKIKVSAGFTGVIATGSYENMRPSYVAEVEFDIQDGLPEADVLNTIKSQQQILQDVCLKNFKQDEQRAIVDRINRERKDFRWYGDYPSVTSIIGWDADFFVPPDELIEYAAQGSLIDAQFKEFVKTGKVVPVKDIQGTWTDIVILKQGKLHLETEGWDIGAFFKKHKVEEIEIGVPVVSNEHKFGGTPDVRKCIYEGKKTLLDVKRTLDKIKNFKQIAAYIIAEEENGETPYEQMMVAIINDKTEQGFSKPALISTRDGIDQYKQMFLRDRESFRKRFGV